MLSTSYPTSGSQSLKKRCGLKANFLIALAPRPDRPRLATLALTTQLILILTNLHLYIPVAIFLFVSV